MSRPELDPILQPILDARDDQERDDETTRLLLETAAPVIDDVIHRTLRREEIELLGVHEDIRAEATYRILRRLALLERDAGANPIASIREYVAVAAYNVFHDFLRRLFPERTRLSNRVRYLLTTDAMFAMWEQDATLLCGFAQWRGQPHHGAPIEVRGMPAARDIHGTRRQLIEIFSAAGGPVSCVELVSALSDAERRPSYHGHDVEPSTSTEPLLAIENRQYLQKLWREICLLPQRQRIALLLNLRDSRGDGVVRLLPLLGIASVAEIRSVLALPAETFQRLWASVPIRDEEIAAILGATRQQVVNLRSGARKRLARRMARES